MAEKKEIKSQASKSSKRHGQSTHMAAAGAKFPPLTEEEMKILWQSAERPIKELKKCKEKYDLTEVDLGYRWRDEKITDEIAIRVHVEWKERDREKLEKLKKLVPRHIGAFATDVIQSKYNGKPQLANEDGEENSRQPVLHTKAKFDMIRGGIQVQNPEGPGWGTLGAIVYNTENKAMALSNEHVFGAKDQPIHQPGPDHFDPIGLVDASFKDLDCAIASLNGTRKVSNTIYNNPGGVKGMVTPSLGMKVIKFGAATGKTSGMIEGVAANQFTVVPYPPIWGPKSEVSQGGDSGAVWLDETSHAAVGLHKTGEKITDWREERAHATRMDRIVDEKLKIKLIRERTLAKGVTKAPVFAVKSEKSAKKSQLLACWVAHDGRSLKFQLSKDGVEFRVLSCLNDIASADAPALVFFDNNFVVAWTTAGTGQLNFARLDNGEEWNNLTIETLNKARASSPSLAVFNDYLYLAWRDPRGDRLRIMRSKDGKVWSKMDTRGMTKIGPSLAATEDCLAMAGRGVDYRLFVRLSKDGKKFTETVFLKEWTASKPALFGLENQLFCAWVGIEDQRLQMIQSSDGGKSWGAKITLQNTSISSPAIAKIGDAFVWSWVNKDAELSTLTYDLL